MNHKLLQECRDLLGLRPAEKVCLLVLATHADKHGICFPTMQTLAAETGLHLKTAKAAVTSLLKLRIIEDTGGKAGHTKCVRILRIDVRSWPQKGTAINDESGPLSYRKRTPKRVVKRTPKGVPEVSKEGSKEEKAILEQQKQQKKSEHLKLLRGGLDKRKTEG